MYTLWSCFFYIKVYLIYFIYIYKQQSTYTLVIKCKIPSYLLQRLYLTNNRVLLINLLAGNILDTPFQ